MLFLLILFAWTSQGDNFPKSTCLFLSDALPVQWWLAGCETYNQHQACGVHHACFNQPWKCSDPLVTQFTDDSGAEFSIQAVDQNGDELFSDSFNKSGSVYTHSFIPSALSICDKKMQLRIVDETSPETDVAQTDAIDVQAAPGCTELVEYYNTNRNYAGLKYSDISPDIIFYARIPSIFFHERPVTQDKAIELTDMVITTSGSFKWQKQLETNYMPYYMHRKLALILKHQFVTIQEKEWIMEQGYEIMEGDRRWPLKKAKVLLTDKNSIIRNIL